MKKITALLILSALVLSLVSCSSAISAPSETAEPASSSSASVSSAPETDDGPTTAEKDLAEIDKAAEKAASAFDGYDTEVYYVGKNRQYRSFVSLLLDLKGNENPKTIYLDEGEYDLFAEYTAERKTGRIVVPLDTITSPDYFEPYNAFVPNHTRVVGVGEVTLRFTPSANEITYGASRTWSPLNVYGNVMFENLTVIGKNCRYCLHNDDHGKYTGAYQYYKNVKLEYQLSEKDSQGRLLGFNNTVGFGISNKSVHLFEDCEIYFNGDGNHSAYYGHGPSNIASSTIVLRNCYVHASDETNDRVIRLQTLSTGTPGKIMTLIDNCRVNGKLYFNQYHAESIQSFAVFFRNTEHMKIVHSNSEDGAIRDPYKVQYFD